MNKLFTLTAAVLALTASVASAQDVGRSKDIVESAPAAAAPAPVPGPVSTFPTATAPSCTLMQVRVEVLKKPARFVVAAFDQAFNETGSDADKAKFVDEMKTCNGDVIAVRPNSKYVSVDIHVVSDTQGWATIKVPASRKAKMVATFHSSVPELKATPFWASAQFADLTQVDLKTVNPGTVAQKHDKR